jgi:serine/threonine protein kinase
MNEVRRPDEVTLGLSVAQVIDPVCDRFEAAWKCIPAAKPPPRLEAFLGSTVGQERAALLRELLLLEIYYRARRGECPKVDGYRARFPEFEEKWLADSIAAQTAPSTEAGDAVIAHGKQHPAEEDLSLSLEFPRQLGEYRILRQVGRGGMGVVYEAVQETLGRHVALKVLALNPLAGPMLVERFRREARAAAKLHHTNIVPVYGVGEQAGVHYYAMQFIHGQGLNDVLREVKRLRGSRQATQGGGYASLAASVAQGLLTGEFVWASVNEKALTLLKQPQATPCASRESAEPRKHTTDQLQPVEERPSGHAGDSITGLGGLPEARYFRSVARLGMQVAEALDYAHGQGVLHRDIKPSNLLLDTAGTVWLTDFGLAKAADADDLTNPGDVVGTLRYLAPERLEGRADPRSDVYGLGVTLYELLTLRPVLDDANRARLIERVRSEKPPPPRKLDPRIPRDLETIVLKAMAKEPPERYPTAAALVEDLRRFLADRPIRARRSTVREQTWRWCRRNPAVAALLAALILVLAGGLAGVTWQWRRAEAQRNRAETSYRLAREGLEQCVKRVAEDPRLKSGELEDLRRTVLEAEALFYQKFVELRGAEPGFQAEQGEAYLQWGHVTAQLGTKAEAIDHYQKALAIFAALAHDSRDTPAYQMKLADTYLDMGLAYRRSGWMKEAEQAYEEAEKRFLILARHHPTDPEPQCQLARCYNALGVLYWEIGRPTNSEQACQEALAIRKALVRDHPEVPRYRLDLAMTSNNLGNYCKNARQLNTAEQYYKDALALALKLVQDYPADSEYLSSLAIYRTNLGCCYRDCCRLQDAEQSFREALALGKRLVREHPAVTDYTVHLGTTLCDLGFLTLDTSVSMPASWTVEAVNWLTQAIATLEPVLKREPGHPRARHDLRRARERLGYVLDGLARHHEALAMWERALEFDDGTPRPVYLLQHARTLARLKQHSRAVLEAKSLAEAEDASARTLFDASRVYAVSVAAVDTNGTAAEDYAARAVALLRQAFARGFHDPRALRADDSFDALRERTDFQQLLADLKVPPPRRVAEALEGEDLRIVNRSKQCPTSIQDMRVFGLDIWSDDKQLFGSPVTAGEWVDFEVPVQVDGPQHLIVYLTRAQDFGIVQFSINGKFLGKPIDLFHSHLQPTVAPVDLGTIELKRGTATLRLELIGADEQSIGLRYAWGLDCLVLQPEHQVPGR